MQRVGSSSSTFRLFLLCPLASARQRIRIKGSTLRRRAIVPFRRYPLPRLTPFHSALTKILSATSLESAPTDHYQNKPLITPFPSALTNTKSANSFLLCTYAKIHFHFPRLRSPRPPATRQDLLELISLRRERRKENPESPHVRPTCEAPSPCFSQLNCCNGILSSHGSAGKRDGTNCSGHPAKRRHMIFANRTEAGQELALRLRQYANRDDVIVLGAPRGGVPVAFEVAKELRAPLDVFVLRKLGVPGHEELAFGAIASGGVQILDPEIVEGLGITALDIKRVTRAEEQELERRERAYRGGRPPLDVSGLTVILVDDGIATGSSMRAAIRALWQMKPARIVIAVPVAPLSTCNELQFEVDELVCLEMPEPFYGVGQFYDDFSQVSDEQVKELLDSAARQRREPRHQDAQAPARGTGR